MTNTHNTPENVSKNYLGLLLMMGMPIASLEKFAAIKGQEIEIPDGHLEDRKIELMELNFHREV
jgi:hypothetical protein